MENVGLLFCGLQLVTTLKWVGRVNPMGGLPRCEPPPPKERVRLAYRSWDFSGYVFSWFGNWGRVLLDDPFQCAVATGWWLSLVVAA